MQRPEVSQLALAILLEVARVRRMHGYTAPDASGTDASVWLGTSLHRIEDAALALLAPSELDTILAMLAPEPEVSNV